jgi:DNA-binding winged helix-turn-helix (wHTH) protein
MKNNSRLTFSENAIFNVLRQNIGQIISRDLVAQAIWNKLWIEKYSDWTIDTLVYRLRHKLPLDLKLDTIRNRGFILSQKETIVPPKTYSILKEPGYTFPSQEYLNYMNNPKNIRKTLFDLFSALRSQSLENNILPNLNQAHPARILIIDSYSADNIDAVSGWISQTMLVNPEIYFTGFDERALQLHRLKINSGVYPFQIQVLYDDIRQSKIKSGIFDLVINDFRLNFNTTHTQNILSVKAMRRILKPQSFSLISVVVDPRYESSRFGKDQEKAPLNIHSPGIFYADEHLPRNCHTVPYYKSLFQKAGFRIITEFDIKEGKSWVTGFKSYTPDTGPTYRRFLVRS